MHVDLSALDAVEQKAAFETIAETLQSSLNLSEGLLLRAAYFTLGSNDSRLLLIIHHLAVDGVSWRILLEDLQLLCDQLQQGEQPLLPAKTTSFKQWGEALVKYAESGEPASESSYWLAKERMLCAPLPRDFIDGRNTVASSTSHWVRFSEEETLILLQEVPKIYRAGIEDVLLTGLAHALATWTGSRFLQVDLEGHGREEIVEEADISRTVGWFTTVYPVLFEISPRVDPQRQLRAIKEQLGSIPKRGIGYGVLRYLGRDNDLVTRLKALPRPEISFNYLGQLDRVLEREGLFASAPESPGRARSG